MSTRNKVHAVLALVAGSALVFGCASIFGLEELHEQAAVTEAGITDASQPDAPDTYVPETGAGCTDPGYPPAPTKDSPDAGDFTVIVALNTIDFGLSTDGGPPHAAGLNLDRACTVSTGTESCVSGALGTNFTNYVVDKTDSGIDNAGGSLIQYISKMGPAFTPENINGRLQQGQYGVVLQITGYNGQADDTQVAVSFFPSFGLNVDAGITNTPSDLWRVDPADLGAAETSQWIDTTAYVVGGKVVAHFAQAPLKLTVDENNPLLTLRFDDAVMTADLVLDGNNTFRLTNGIVSGRVKTDQFLGSVDQLFYNPDGPNTFICVNPIFRGFIQTTVCGARDIMSNSLQDNMKLPCDAFSAGAAFDTYAVDKWHQANAPAPLEAGCPAVQDCPAK